jgi:hypothetical protein
MRNRRFDPLRYLDAEDRTLPETTCGIEGGS